MLPASPIIRASPLALELCAGCGAAYLPGSGRRCCGRLDMASWHGSVELRRALVAVERRGTGSPNNLTTPKLFSRVPAAVRLRPTLARWQRSFWCLGSPAT